MRKIVFLCILTVLYFIPVQIVQIHYRHDQGVAEGILYLYSNLLYALLLWIPLLLYGRSSIRKVFGIISFMAFQTLYMGLWISESDLMPYKSLFYIVWGLCVYVIAWGSLNLSEKKDICLSFFRKRLSPESPHGYKVKNGRISLYKQSVDLRKLAREYISCNFECCNLSNDGYLYWLQHRKFRQCTFHEVSFGNMADHGNFFEECSFMEVDFRHSILGYESTEYRHCKFEKVKFRNFIKARFFDCEFLHCDFRGVDFDASSFDGCVFIGEIRDAWFRGNFSTIEDEKNYGKAQQNEMRNVSFRDAELHDVHFSDNCDLSTIVFPKEGDYLYFDNWDKQLDTMRNDMINEKEQKAIEEIGEFTDIHKIHSESQSFYILNIEDLKKDFCPLTVQIIKRNATSEVFNGVYHK